MKVGKIFPELFAWIRLEGWFLLAVFLIGLSLRLLPGRDHLIWDYDQVRDAYDIRRMITTKDPILVGPQTEYESLRHGPLHYYLFAPFYAISPVDPNLAIFGIALINLSTLLPLGLLTQELFKDRRVTRLALLLWAVSYGQIEYARWLSNVAITLPFLAWFAYFSWQGWTKRRDWFWVGLFLGLSVLGEIFLLYLIAWCVLALLYTKAKREEWLQYGAGLALGLLPLWLAEIKFGFRGAKSFAGEFIARHNSEPLSSSTAVLHLLDNLSVSTKQTLAGLSYPMAGVILGALVFFAVFVIRRTKSANEKMSLLFVLWLLFNYVVIFTFHNIKAVFLNLTVYMPLVILGAWAIVRIWKEKQYQWFAVACWAFVLISQLSQLKAAIETGKPFAHFSFTQDALLLKHRLAVVERAYQLTGTDEPMSMAFLGNPYGVRTVWASAFEIYSQRNNYPLPKYYGYHANGYPGDFVLVSQDFPQQKHILIIEPNGHLLPPTIGEQFIAEQDRATRVVYEETVVGYRIQLREPLEHLSNKK